MYIWNDFTGDYTDDKATAVKTVFQFSTFNILRHSLGSNKLTQAFLSRVILFEIPSLQVFFPSVYKSHCNI